MEERNRRKVLRGTVISDKMDKTIVVEIATTKSHPLYGRRVKYSITSTTSPIRASLFSS